MTRIALISDQHFDLSSRWDECLRITEWIADDIAERQVDLIALGGDLFERRPVPEESAAAARWLIGLAESAPVIAVYGNHDVPLALEVYNHLDAQHGIYFYDRPGMRELAGVAIACLPWPTKAGVLASMPEAGKEAGEQAAGDALRSILRGLGAQIIEHDGPRILLAHAMIRGSRTSTGQPLCGMEFELGLDDLSMVGADAYLLGHIHCSQDWTINGAPVIYPGSPRRTAYGEVEDKGYVVLDFSGQRIVDWERVKTPATPMLLLEATYTDGALVLSDDQKESIDEAPAAEIRLRYSVASDQREPAKIAAQRLADWLREQRQAIAVKVEEEVTTSVRARAPEIAAAHTLPDKLDALWRLQGFDPGERRPALFEKVAAIEKEISNAA